jgi:hypothetical protein
MVHEHAVACARETIEDEAEGIERFKSPPLMYDRTFVVDHSLLSERESAESVIKYECELAGKGSTHRRATARGPKAIRGSSLHVRGVAGDRSPPTPPRVLSPSITLMREAIAAEDSRRAVD